MELSFFIFFLFGSILSFVDAKKGIIPDKISIPAIILLSIAIFVEQKSASPFLTAALALLFFTLLLFFFADFGGGDLRFVVFCAIFLDFPDIFLFFIFAGVLHIVFLAITRRRIYGFAPSMFAAALGAKALSPYIWSF